MRSGQRELSEASYVRSFCGLRGRQEAILHAAADEGRGLDNRDEYLESTRRCGRDAAPEVLFRRKTVEGWRRCVCVCKFELCGWAGLGHLCISDGVVLWCDRGGGN